MHLPETQAVLELKPRQSFAPIRIVGPKAPHVSPPWARKAEHQHNRAWEAQQSVDQCEVRSTKTGLPAVMEERIMRYVTQRVGSLVRGSPHVSFRGERLHQSGQLTVRVKAANPEWVGAAEGGTPFQKLNKSQRQAFDEAREARLQLGTREIWFDVAVDVRDPESGDAVTSWGLSGAIAVFVQRNGNYDLPEDELRRNLMFSGAAPGR